MATQRSGGADAVGAVPDGGADHEVPPARLTHRESGWVLRRCGRRGHVLGYLDDAPVASALAASSGDRALERCLRCATFVDPGDPATGRTQALGSPQAPIPLGQLPQVVRGAHGRKLALLRVLAVERGGRGLLLLLAALGIAQLASSHVALAEWLGRIAEAARPLGDQIGWDVAHSSLVTDAVGWLGHASSTYTTIAWLVGGYGALQLTEGIGLWGGWRWAEYLAAIATTAFVPLEIYELYHNATILKAGALLVNLLAVAYLVLKGRLFGVRGGHHAYLAEVRDATLIAEVLRAIGRPVTVLTSHELV